MKWQYLYLKLSSRSIGVAYLEIEKDAACMHTELSAVLNSCFVNNIGITIESADTCSDFFPEIQNLSSLVFLSLVIEGTPSGKILLTCHDLLPQSKMHTWKTFFFYIIYDYYHYDIIISDSSSYKSVGIHWTIVFNISI